MNEAVTSETLTMDELKYVQDEVQLKGKRLWLSYVLILLVGNLGIHLGYLEKTKTAVLKALLNISIIAMFFPIQAAVISAETYGITIELQQYSSTLFVLHMSLILASLFWMMYDLVALPSMVKKVNNKIESDSKTKTFQSRNVEGKIRQDETSDRMIELISGKLSSEINSKSQMIEDEISAIHKKLIDKNEGTNDLIESVGEKLKELEKLSVKLEEKTKDMRKSNADEVELMKSEIEDHIEKVKVDLGKKFNGDNQYKENEPIDKLRDALENTFKDKSKESSINNEQKEVVSKDSEIKKPSSEIIDDEMNTEGNEKEIEDNNVQETAAEEDLLPASEETLDNKENSNEELFIDEKQLESEEIVLDEVVETEKIELEDTTIKTEDTVIDNKESSDEGIFTVDQAIKEGKGGASVSGFVVGYMNPNKHNIVFDNFDGDMNIVIADNMEERDPEKMLTIQLTWDSKLRDDIGLLSNPENLSKEIIVNGEISKYFKGLGLKKVSSMKFIETEDEFISRG